MPLYYKRLTMNSYAKLAPFTKNSAIFAQHIKIRWTEILPV